MWPVLQLNSTNYVMFQQILMSTYTQEERYWKLVSGHISYMGSMLVPVPTEYGKRRMET